MQFGSSNSFFDRNEMELHEYWKGQVSGILKACETLGFEIDKTYYLNRLF